MGSHRKKITWIVTKNGCHECTSHGKDSHGYPHLWKNGTGHHAHRVLYEEQVGPITQGLVVRHKCDNRSCINLEHLELGTLKDNSQDCKKRGRLNTPYGETRSDAKLTTMQIFTIRTIQGISQAQLACDFGVNQSTISRIRSRQKRIYD